MMTTRLFTSALDPLLLFLLSGVWGWVGLRAKLPFPGAGEKPWAPAIYQVGMNMMEPLR